MNSADDWRVCLSEWLAQDDGVLTLARLVGAEALSAQLEASGFAATVIEFADISDKAGLMATMRQALGLDDWFGANWDALADALFGPEHPAAPTRVLVLRLPDEGPLLPESDWAMLLDIIREVAAAQRSTLKGAVILSDGACA